METNAQKVHPRHEHVLESLSNCRHEPSLTAANHEARRGNVLLGTLSHRIPNEVFCNVQGSVYFVQYPDLRAFRGSIPRYTEATMPTRALALDVEMAHHANVPLRRSGDLSIMAS